MLVEILELIPNEGEGFGGGDERAVVLHSHLLHLSPDPLGIHAEKLRLLRSDEERSIAIPYRRRGIERCEERDWGDRDGIGLPCGGARWRRRGARRRRVGSKRRRGGGARKPPWRRRLLQLLFLLLHLPRVVTDSSSRSPCEMVREIGDEDGVRSTRTPTTPKAATRLSQRTRGVWSLWTMVYGPHERHGVRAWY